MLVDKPLPSVRPTGIGVAAFNMAIALSKRKNEIFYLCRGDSGVFDLFDGFLRVRTVRNYSRGNLREAIRELGKEGSDLVHIHSSSALPSLVLAKLFRYPVVTHSHADWPMHPWRLAIMRQAGAKLSQKVVAVSNRVKMDLIRNHRISSSKISVVYNGVDTDLFAPAAESTQVISKYGLESRGPILLSIATLQARKGQLHILECLPSLIRRWPKLTYLNVGPVSEESYRQLLLLRTRELGIENHVAFFSGIPQSDLIDLINAADLCVQPSLNEAFGLSIVEEMACGRPVLAYKSGAFPEIIQSGVDGYLIEPLNIQMLAATIMNMLENREELVRLGKNARTKALDSFTWDLTAARLEDVYRELVV